MAKSIIIYGTNYGTTEKYAQELAKRTGIQAVSYKQVEMTQDCEVVIYFVDFKKLEVIEQTL